MKFSFKLCITFQFIYLILCATVKDVDQVRIFAKQVGIVGDLLELTNSWIFKSAKGAGRSYKGEQGFS